MTLPSSNQRLKNFPGRNYFENGRKFAIHGTIYYAV